ncbi:MAG: ATP-dependent endonuclease, partial [Flavobacteriales bacterium]
KTTIKRTKEELENKDVAVFGKRVLTMANQEGKGWFAIMLGKHIFFKTIIPDYIVEAIVFAKESYSKNIIADIIEYRINKNSKEKFYDKVDFTLLKDKLSDYRSNKASIDDVIAETKATTPNDQILTFLKKVK